MNRTGGRLSAAAGLSRHQLESRFANMSSTYSADTEILYRGSQVEGESLHPESPAIYHATAYIMADLDEYEDVNSGKGGYLYNRTANPNRDGLAQVVSYLEKGEQSIICSSGMAAISTALLAFLKAGDHLVASKAIYGETIELFENLLAKFGVQITLVDFTDLDAIRAAIGPETKVLYTEVIANPLITVVDLDAIAQISKEAGTLLMVDNTFSTPFVIRPLEHGADLVIHSLTKFFNGHSDVTAGSVTGSAALIKAAAAAQLMLGCCADPNSSWLALRAVRTMGLRVRKQLKNAQLLAQLLDKDPRVDHVNYLGLESHPQHALASRLLLGGYGPMISFHVADDREKVNDFIHRLKLVKYLGTLGGYRTSIAHPATAFRLDFPPEKLLEMGMTEGLIRISTGVEDMEDLAEDFTQALGAFD